MEVDVDIEERGGETFLRFDLYWFEPRRSDMMKGHGGINK